MKKNRIRIWGRNTSTPPVPARMPSTSRLCSTPGGRPDADEVAQRIHAGLDPLHGHSGQAEHRLKHQEQRHGQQQHAPQRMQHHAVDGVIGVQAVRRLTHGHCQNAPHLLLGRDHLRHIRRMPGWRRRGGGQMAGAPAGRPGPETPAIRCAPSCRTPTVSSTGMPNSRDSRPRSITMPSRDAPCRSY